MGSEMCIRDRPRFEFRLKSSSDSGKHSCTGTNITGRISPPDLHRRVVTNLFHPPTPYRALQTPAMKLRAVGGEPQRPCSCGLAFCEENNDFKKTAKTKKQKKQKNHVKEHENELAEPSERDRHKPNPAKEITHCRDAEDM